MEKNEKLEFIEIRRIVSEGKMNMGSQPEVIPLHSISGFRAWHKGANDNYIKGDMVIIYLKPKKKQDIEKTAIVGEDNEIIEKTKEPTDKLKTMLIEESYNSFLNRMSHYVAIRTLPPEDEAL